MAGKTFFIRIFLLEKKYLSEEEEKMLRKELLYGEKKIVRKKVGQKNILVGKSF